LYAKNDDLADGYESYKIVNQKPNKFSGKNVQADIKEAKKNDLMNVYEPKKGVIYQT
jgi:hypothetical protein